MRVGGRPVGELGRRGRKPARLAQGLPQGNSGGHRYIERAGARDEGNRHPDVSRSVNFIRNAGRFTTKQERVAGLERSLVQPRAAARGEEDQSRTGCNLLFAKRKPAGMTENSDVFSVVHRCAAQRLVGEREAAGLNQVNCDAKARR